MAFSCPFFMPCLTPVKLKLVIREFAAVVFCTGQINDGSYSWGKINEILLGL